MTVNSAAVYQVDNVTDFAVWRHRALQAIRAGLKPDALQWETVARDTPSLPFGGGGSGNDLNRGLEQGLGHRSDRSSDRSSGHDLTRQRLGLDLPEAQLTVTKAFATLLREASTYRTPDRWWILYAGLWRWSQGRREVASAADDIGGRLHHMAKAVRRDRHDFIAYLRFREQRAEPPAPRFVGWYEPDHDTLEWAAEHFADRMGGASFLIATPDRAVWWDGSILTFRDTLTGSLAQPPVLEADARDEASTALWLTYYRSIFNPARLNERALVQHMPVRRWRGLPEASVIPELLGAARNGGQRVGQVAAVGARPGRVIRSDAGAAPSCQSHERAADVGLFDVAGVGASSSALPATLDACRRCDLWRTATGAVAGEGPARARLMLVGEQPGDQEDLAGKVFVGPAGQLLNEALERAGIARDALYLTNAVKHFKWEPRGKRRLHKTPQQREVDACRHWLDDELARVEPLVVVTLGATALTSVVTRGLPLTRHLNTPMRHDGRWVVPTYHPAYALRQTQADGRARAFDTLVAGLTQAKALLPDE